MKILVTGSSGYIGANFVRYLTQNKNVSTVSYDKIEGEYVEDIEYLRSVDCIVHLAALSSISECQENIGQAVNDNVYSTVKLFSTAFNHGVPVVFASSGSAQSPNDNIYAMTKYIGEYTAFKLNKKGADIKCLRFANVYGGVNFFGNKSSVVAKFHEDDVITVNGDGSQTRDFIHISDVCGCIWQAIKCEDVINEPIGVGTGVNTSVLNLAKMTSKKYIFDPDSDMVGVDESPAEVQTAEKYLGFKADVRLLDYILHTF